MSRNQREICDRFGVFVALPPHVAHLDEWCPELIPYLALPPGWAVLLAPGYEDVWIDEKLLVE